MDLCGKEGDLTSKLTVRKVIFMKKFLPLILALIMSLALAAPAFAESTPVPPSDAEEEDYGIMPLMDIYSESMVASTSGRWESPKFSATPGNGGNIRFWFSNTTGEAVKVYLFWVDSLGVDRIARSMEVPANSQKSAVYSSSRADSYTYRVVVEAFVSGGDITGSLNVAQYTEI